MPGEWVSSQALVWLFNTAALYRDPHTSWHFQSPELENGFTILNIFGSVSRKHSERSFATLIVFCLWNCRLKLEGSKSELSLKKCGLSEIRIPQILRLIIIFLIQKCMHHFQTYPSIIILLLAVYPIIIHSIHYIMFVFTPPFSAFDPMWKLLFNHHVSAGCTIWLEPRRHPMFFFCSGGRFIFVCFFLARFWHSFWIPA